MVFYGSKQEGMWTAEGEGSVGSRGDCNGCRTELQRWPEEISTEFAQPKKEHWRRRGQRETPKVELQDENDPKCSHQQQGNPFSFLTQVEQFPPNKSRLIFRWASPRTPAAAQEMAALPVSCFLQKNHHSHQTKTPLNPFQKYYPECFLSPVKQEREAEHVLPLTGSHLSQPAEAEQSSDVLARCWGHPTCAAQPWPRKLPCFLTAHPHKQLPCLQCYVTPSGQTEAYEASHTGASEIRT